MFIKSPLAFLISGAILLSACTADSSGEQTREKAPSQQEPAVSEETPAVGLTSDEQERYTRFQKDLDLKHLQDLEPISIAKMYAHAVLEQNHNVQYALYTDRAESVQWSLEEDKKFPESHRGTYEQNRKIFNNIGSGRFIQTSDTEGYIEYDSGEGLSGFQLIQNEDGTWQAAFLPVQ